MRRQARPTRAAVGALKHPAAGVRKAAAMVLPHTARSGQAILAAGLLRDPDLHTRLAAVAGAGRHAGLGGCRSGALQGEPGAAELHRQVAEPRLLHRGDAAQDRVSRPRTTLIKAALPYAALPVALRIGNIKPDWRTPPASGPCDRLEGDAGAGQLGVARLAGFRRRRVVHAHDRLARRRHARGADARAGAQLG